MPNLLDQSGLQIKSHSEVVADLTAAYQSIYGTDVNLGSDTPDGQLLNIFAQEIIDTLDLTAQVYSSMDPDQAIGTTLDARVAYNGVKRKGGSFTLSDVTIVTDRPVSLIGLDSDINNPLPDLSRGVFTITDNAGNHFYLTNSYNIGTAGSTTLVFRAADTGAIGTTPGTITTPITVIIGVVSVYNYGSALSIGLPQEQDSSLKVRRKKSVAISARGFYDTLKAALLDIDGVTSAEVYENTTGSTNTDGVPGHSIWVIVNGGADADIAQAIYAKRGAGAGMYGARSYTVIRSNGSPFVVKWDIVTTQTLYLKFQLDMISGDVITTGNIPAAVGTVITAIPTTAGILPGHLIRGAGIPSGSRVVSVNSATSLTISAATTGTGSTAATLTIVPVDVVAFKTSIASAIFPGVYQTLDINAISTLAQAINPNVILTNIGLSLDNVTFTPTLTPSAKNRQFSLTSTGITIV